MSHPSLPSAEIVKIFLKFIKIIDPETKFTMENDENVISFFRINGF